MTLPLNDDHNADDSSAPEKPDPLSTTDRRVTFRKRRLSLPLHHLSAGNDESGASPSRPAESPHHEYESSDSPQGQNHGESPISDKAHTFRKRRLSLTQNRHLVEDDSRAGTGGAGFPKRSRRNSEASATSATSNHSSVAPLRPKTVHAGELLKANNSAPPSPAVNSDNILYTRQSLPPPLVLPQQQQQQEREPGVNIASHNSASNLKPKWSKRHTVETGDEHKLPFPRDTVGTYSCHGSEPVYDSSYEEYGEEEEEEGEEGWTATNGGAVAAGGKPASMAAAIAAATVQKPGQEEKPTTTAKINQDRGGVAYPYGNNSKSALFAVYDGHGQGGEHVSQFALHEIQRKLEKHPSFKDDVEKAFKETFLEVDEALKHEPLIEPYFSGTTACVALLANNKLSIANAGDSRAVLARKDPSSGTWQALDLTEDQNPDLPQEMQRITAAGGFVSPAPAPGLSARVWLDASCTQIGLAMARSIGDHAVSAVGVIAEPVVTFHELEEEDDFMILASDGVWEFVQSEEAVKIVGDNLDRGATKACQALIEAAAAKWHEEEGEYRDDITAIVVRLQDLWKK